MLDTRRNFIFREVHPAISEKEYMNWFLSITCQIITPNPAQVPPRKEMEHKPRARRIQNVDSKCCKYLFFL